MVPEVLTFTKANWNDFQDIAVTAVNDRVAESDPHVVFLHHRTSSADVDYDNIAMSRSKFKCRTTTKLH